MTMTTQDLATCTPPRRAVRGPASPSVAPTSFSVADDGGVVVAEHGGGAYVVQPRRRIRVNMFAGGGGASEGEREATGTSPTLVINHWPVALAIHRANHPDSIHLIEDVFRVDPRVAAYGCEVECLWASPTCTHFSRASGEELKDGKIRAQAWSILPWIKYARPVAIVVENVVEFLQWGPLHRTHTVGCPMFGERATSCRARCKKKCQFGTPIKTRAGETFRAWEHKIRSKGYSFSYRKLVAWEYGAPTTRERVYIVMLRDGAEFEWPSPTHARVPTPERPNLWRTAADIIDWSIPAPSIFTRKKPLVHKTEARLVRGLGKFVLQAARPFLISVDRGCAAQADGRAPRIDVQSACVLKVKSYGGGGNDAASVAEPLRTVTASKRGEFAVGVASLSAPYMVHRSNGERVGQAPRVYDVQAPHPTIVAQGLKTSVVEAALVEDPQVAAFLATHFSERRAGEVMARELDRPTGAVTAKDHHALVAASLIKFYGTSSAVAVDRPLDTVTGGGWKHAVSTAFLSRYNGQSVGQVADSPIGTLDSHDRYSVVEAEVSTWSPEVETRAHQVYDLMVRHGYAGPGLDHERRIVVVTIGGVQFVVGDLGMRMLVPRELFLAQGFPPDYVLDVAAPNGRAVTNTDLIRACGNSVCPPVAAAIVRSVMRAIGSPSTASATAA